MADISAASRDLDISPTHTIEQGLDLTVRWYQGNKSKMKITIYGAGYVGLVTGACLADVGNEVLLVDVDEARVAALKCGEIPIYEPG